MLYFKLEAERSSFALKQYVLLTDPSVEDRQGAIRESHQDSTFDVPVKKKQTSGRKNPQISKTQ